MNVKRGIKRGIDKKGMLWYTIIPVSETNIDRAIYGDEENRKAGNEVTESSQKKGLDKRKKL